MYIGYATIASYASIAVQIKGINLMLQCTITTAVIDNS